MTPGMARKTIISDRAEWVSRMIAEIRRLPLGDFEVFSADSRNVWAAESCLRRALEALMDMGRHILAKAYGKGVAEYKRMAEECEKEGVLSKDQAALLRTLAGYRNRMVHFYHEISPDELYSICHDELGDLLTIREAFIEWTRTNPDRVDEGI